MKASSLIKHLADLIQDHGDKEVPVKVRIRNEFDHIIEYNVHEIVFVAMTEAGIIIEEKPERKIKL